MELWPQYKKLANPKLGFVEWGLTCGKVLNRLQGQAEPLRRLLVGAAVQISQQLPLELLHLLLPPGSLRPGVMHRGLLL
jgi:hypothetical protein